MLTNEEIIAALEPLARKWVYEDHYGHGGLPAEMEAEDRAEFPSAFSDDSEDDVFIRAGDIRRARRVIAALKEKACLLK